MPYRSIRLFLILAAMASITALAGCGAQSTAQNIPSATPSAATATPSPTPPPTVDPALLAQKCGKDFPTLQASVVGGLAVAQQAIFGNLAYPATKLPDDLPLKPYQVQSSGGQSDPAFVPVNPFLHEQGGGYVIVICNISAEPHTVQRIDARIAAVTSISTTPNASPACQRPYSRQYGAGSGGCGGADFENEYMHAAFSPSAGAGATVTATQTATNTCEYKTGCATNYGPLPVTLQAGQWMTIEVGIASASNPTTIFDTSGYYTFSFGVGVDGAAPVFAVTSPQTLLDPFARLWTDVACQSSAMQAQIPPATTPPSYYLCPSS